MFIAISTAAGGRDRGGAEAAGLEDRRVQGGRCGRTEREPDGERSTYHTPSLRVRRVYAGASGTAGGLHLAHRHS